MWNKEVVKQHLRNPVYIGLPAWNKRAASRFKEYVNGQIQDVTSKVGGRKREATDYVQPEKPEFPPIVDLETWQKVQAKIESAKQGKRPPAQVAELWLKPFLYCGKCNKPMRAWKASGRMKHDTYFCGTYGTYGKDNPSGCRCHRVRHDVLEALVEKYLDEVAEPVAALAACDDSGLFDATYREWAKSVTERNRLWVRMADTVQEWGDDWWNIEKYYQPSDCPELLTEIEAKEAELDELLAGFFKLSPALQQRANERAEALQAEIDSLKEQVEDLTAPWLEVSHEAHKRSEAMQYAASLSEQTGPKRAEALRSVVDRIVCHFRYTKGNRSMIDAVEVVPVSGDTLCFTEEVSQGRD